MPIIVSLFIWVGGGLLAQAQNGDHSATEVRFSFEQAAWEGWRGDIIVSADTESGLRAVEYLSMRYVRDIPQGPLSEPIIQIELRHVTEAFVHEGMLHVRFQITALSMPRGLLFYHYPSEGRLVIPIDLSQKKAEGEVRVGRNDPVHEPIRRYVSNRELPEHLRRQGGHPVEVRYVRCPF